MQSLVYFAAILVIANASVLFARDTVVASPVSRTSIVGPSGSIHKEELAPVIARRYAAAAPVIPATVHVPAVRVAHVSAPLVLPAPVFRGYSPHLYNYFSAPAVFDPVFPYFRK